MIIKNINGTFWLRISGMIVCLLVACINCGCSAPDTTKKTQSELAAREVASLTSEDLSALERNLRKIRGQTPLNCSEEPIVLLDSDCPLLWKGYGCPFKLLPSEENVFPEVEHQVPPEMTTEELMQAFGWVHKNAEDYYNLSSEKRLEFNKAHPQIEDRGFRSYQVHPAKEIAKNWLDYYIATGRKAERLVEVAHWRGCDQLILEGTPIERSDTLDRITSPVTGDLMEINHSQFSAGNMYIDAFTLQELRDDYGIDVSEFEDIRVRQGIDEDNVVIAFYRAYGTKGTVKTGWLLRDRTKTYTSALST